MVVSLSKSAAWWAATILVLGTSAGRADVIAVDGTTCSLANAILSANSDNAVGGCSAGAGADTLMLGSDVVLTTPVTAEVEGGSSGLPAITTPVTIAAAVGTVVERSSALACAEDATPFRLFEVASSGVLTLSGLSLRNGCVAGGGLESWASGGAILVVAGGELLLVDCRFEGNRARGMNFTSLSGQARGGAIAVLGGRLRVAGSYFVDNAAIGSEPHGGALAIEGGELVELTTSQFLTNHAGRDPLTTYAGSASAGGAISLRQTITGTLAHLVVAGNTLGIGGDASGGGIEVSGGRVRELRDSFFAANVAQAGSNGIGFQPEPGRGGGLANFGTIESILRTTFSANQALGYGTGEGRGGGLDNRGRIGAIVSSTFVGNVAEGGVDIDSGGGNSFGGGLANVGEIGRIVASTLVANRCPQSAVSTLFQGGGIYTSPDYEAGSVPYPGVIVTSSLLAGNEANGAPDCVSTVPFSSGGFNLALFPDGSCHFSAASDIVGVDPQVEPLADNGCTIALPGGSCLPTVALAPTSPALDAGLCSATGSEIDARGAVRPLDLPGAPNAAGSDACDIGAHERDAPLAAVHLGLAIAESGDPVYGGSGAANLTYTVALSSVGMQDAGDVVVTPAPLLPAGVTLDLVTASSGTWDGSTWTHAALASGSDATLAFTLTVGFATAGGPDAVGLSAAVTAATGHSGELAADAEATTVVEGVFIDGFESGDASAWSLTVGGN